MAKHLVFDLDELRQDCDEVNPLDAQQTVKELSAKLKKYDDIYALSAPQIGIKERVICIKFNDNVIKEYINPMILKSEGLHLVRERDISIPDQEFISPRPNKILVRYQTSTAKPEENILKDSVAEVFDRMMHYLQGVTLEDYGLPILDGFDDLEPDEQQKIISMYLESLKKREVLLNDNIENDPDAKELRDAIRFMEAVDKGEVTLGDPSLLKKD